MRELIALLIPAILFAQDIKFPANFSKLAEKAEEVVNVTLDASMLGLAGRFLSEDKDEEASAKRAITGLQGIYIRSFQFAKEGEYSESDIEDIRQQLRAPEWFKVVSVRSKKKNSDNAEIFFKKVGDKMTGLTILAAEPTQLTIVHIVGTMNVEDLGKLGGQFGIPRMNMGPVKDKDKEKEN